MTSSIQSRLGTAPEEGCKAPVKVVANTPITLSGEQTISSTAVVAGDRVLVNGQVDLTENGIYNVSTTAWSYAKDWNKANDVIAGMLVPSSETTELYQLKVFSGDYTAGTTEVEFQTGVIASKQYELQLGSQAVAKVFTLTSMTYIPAGNDLIVERNGQVLILDKHYTETSSTTVTIITTVLDVDDFIFRSSTGVTLVSTTTASVSHTAGGVTYNLATYLQTSRALNVRDYGATGDGVTDDSASIQTVIDLLSATGGVVFFPPGYVYEMKGITIDGPASEVPAIGTSLTIHAPNGALLKNTSSVDGTSMFTISSTANTNFLKVDIAAIQVALGGGHVFDIQGALNHSNISVDFIDHNEPGKSIINHSNTGFYFNRIKGLYWSITSGHTVPAINMTSATNVISANEFDILRPDRGGSVPFMVMDCTAASDFNFGNTIRLSNPEYCDGGVLRISRAANTVIEKMTCFDNGSITNHMIEVGVATFDCKNTKIKDYQRNAGTLGSGIKDIMITDANFTYVENASGTSSGTKITVDLNSQPNTTILGGAWATIENQTTSNTLILNTEEGVATPKLLLTPQSTALTISSGEITVTDSVHSVDTEASAATDDLTTINGSSNGQVLILKSVANARDVTLKDTGGNLFLAGDFVLDRTQDSITLRYDDVLSGWVELSRTDNAS